MRKYKYNMVDNNGERCKKNLSLKIEIVENGKLFLRSCDDVCIKLMILRNGYFWNVVSWEYSKS